ncbi:MAG: glycine betaine ABC transporter substrate-binding protein [Phycisphaerae bacterium]
MSAGDGYRRFRRSSLIAAAVIVAVFSFGTRSGAAEETREEPLAPSISPAERPMIRIGSKVFPESIILGELAGYLIADAGYPVDHKAGLGGTQICWRALRSGEIDIYPDYTGTIIQETLAAHNLDSAEQLPPVLARMGLRMTEPLGFNNTYAVGVRREVAERLGLRTISDLADHPGLTLRFSNEFMDRADGWPGLQAAYDLPQTDVKGLEHQMAYRGIDTGAIDVTDLYSTDAEIEVYDLVVLEDDRNYFPEYKAVFLYRADLEDRAPQAVEALLQLEGAISEKEMIAMNLRVKQDKMTESQAAAQFARSRWRIDVQATGEGFWERLWRNTLNHLLLVAISMTGAIVISVPLGIIAARYRTLGQGILALVGIFQTIPALALLFFMVPLLGIEEKPAIAAMFLYSLLPIVRNTYAGLEGIPPSVQESAQALGLPPMARLRLVELPMALRSILAGIKISAVINVGTATLGGLIGAGGYGQPIMTGIRRDDFGMIMQGAVPAALLAIVVHLTFEAVELLVLPKGLRLKGETH